MKNIIIFIFTLISSLSYLHAMNATITAKELNKKAEKDEVFQEAVAANRAFLSLSDQKEMDELLIITSQEGIEFLPEILHVVYEGADINAIDYPIPEMAEPALLCAIKNYRSGERALVEELLAVHANPDTGNALGMTPLIYAARHNQCTDYALVESLVFAGADPYLTYPSGRTIKDYTTIEIYEKILKAHTTRQNALERLSKARDTLHTLIQENFFVPIESHAKKCEHILYFSDKTSPFLNRLIAQKWLLIKKKVEITRWLQPYLGIPDIISLIDDYTDIDTQQKNHKKRKRSL